MGRKSQKRVSNSLLKGKSYFDQETMCKVHNKTVTLRVNANGVLICREWKPCQKENKKNLSKDGCAQKYFRARFGEIFKRQEKQQRDVGDLAMDFFVRDLGRKRK